MKTSKSHTLGNLTVVKRGKLVELTLNTYHEGRPYALFKATDLPDVIAFLQKHAADNTVEDEDDWRSLI